MLPVGGSNAITGYGDQGFRESRSKAVSQVDLRGGNYKIKLRVDGGGWNKGHIKHIKQVNDVTFKIDFLGRSIRHEVTTSWIYIIQRAQRSYTNNLRMTYEHYADNVHKRHIEDKNTQIRDIEQAFTGPKCIWNKNKLLRRRRRSIGWRQRASAGMGIGGRGQWWAIGFLFDT